MAKEYFFDIYAHPSVYSTKDRKYNIYFSVPDKGVNADTGILLFIAGFGGNANSNVYKKMRNNFSDKYNLITIQCDYFGYEFMQGGSNLILDISKIKIIESQYGFSFGNYNDINKIINAAKYYNFMIPLIEKMNESLDNYNEMGLIQAIDNISAIISVIEIIDDNGYIFNKNKILIYGDSHGAYLGYLCNALAPTMFSLIIDNSAWLRPNYLYENRYLYKFGDGVNFSIEFDYLAKKLEFDSDILDISYLYKKFENKCSIVCYHGTEDNLISNLDKIKLKNFIKNFYYHEIDKNSVDNKIFKNNNHGLGADFVELFDFTFNKYKYIEKTYDNIIKNLVYKTKNHEYVIDYSEKVPKLRIY